MIKREFREAVRTELRKVPLADRQRWDDTALFAWWMPLTVAKPHITWDRCRGDPWQHIKGMCCDLIGDVAIF